ncbi:linear amide C-N hydrolase [Bhargavaea cecembensis]|uniref:linear amide C-N hydrolase n=1 Tax=Bhargavaea cecembensis TaxID=394098 RepID=UPI0006936648|nr:linear amide C-N hydrolase [Bhargavaea cecembensis]
MCTTIGFPHEEGIVFGRTLEMGVKLENQVLFVPRNSKAFVSAAEQNDDSIYATIGTGFMNMAAFGDGINEMGLMGSSNLLPGYASYSKKPVDGKINLTVANAFNYLLSRCRNVEEVRKEAGKLSVLERGKTDDDVSGDMHFFFMDADGDGLVLEPEDGRLLAYDNLYGVLTNAPGFPWHATNLKNYLNLRAENVGQNDWNGTLLSKFGEGSGLVGLPGDFTPPSRFVRAAFFVSATPEALDRLAAILQAFRILSQSDIPTGAVVDPDNGYMDETLYTAVMDSAKKAYFVKGHDNINIQPFYLDDFKDERDIRIIVPEKEMNL